MLSHLTSLYASLLTSLSRAARAVRTGGGPRATLLRALPFGVVLLAPAAHAGNIHAPPGFNIETSKASAGNVAAVLPDGTVLVSTGTFGNDKLSVRHADGSQTLFATGFGSLAGIAESPVTGDLIVGDSLSLPVLHRIRDLNLDGDALDAGENVPFGVDPPTLSSGEAPLPFSLVFRPGTDELYMSGSTLGVFPNPVLGVVVRFAAGSASVFADGLGYASGLLWSGSTLYAADLDSMTFAGRVLALTDGNADGDALDAGESVVFADNLSGASDLVRAKDGSFYLSGLFDLNTFTGSIGRLLPDGNGDGRSDGVDEGWISGFGFAAALNLIEGGAGFAPGAGGDGTLIAQDFSSQTVDRNIRSAPLATLALSGPPANNSFFTLTVGGAPGAAAMVLLSTDQNNKTVVGVGDLCAGFATAFVIVPLPRIGAGGTTSTTLIFHNVDAAVGLPFTAQTLTLEGGVIGIGNAFDLVLAP